MTINICEIEYRESKELLPSKYRAGFKGYPRIDLCEKHKHWYEQFKSPDEMYNALFAIKPTEIKQGGELL